MLAQLETLRRRRGLSQSRLAARADVSPRTIYNIEKGVTTTPQGKVMLAIAQVLGVAPEEVDEFRPALGLDPMAPKAAGVDSRMPGRQAHE